MRERVRDLREAAGAVFSHWENQMLLCVLWLLLLKLSGLSEMAVAYFSSEEVKMVGVQSDDEM
jgi:hypothetical protein